MIKNHLTGIKNIGLLAVILSLFLGGLSSVAEAATGLTIQPVKASYTIEPMAGASGVINLTNPSSQDVEVTVKVEDFIPLAGANSIQFVGRAPGLTTVRDWVTVDSPETFEFKPGETRQIRYRVNAPADAEPGSHLGVIFFKAVEKNQDNVQLKVGTQVGMLLLVTVPGDFVQSGEILDFYAQKFQQKAPVPFTIRFENTGTVHYEPRGTIEITNMFGKIISVVPVEGQVVLPTGVKDLAVMWNPSRPVFGRYTASLTMDNLEGSAVPPPSVFYVIPVVYLAYMLACVILVFFIIWFIKRKVKISIGLK